MMVMMMIATGNMMTTDPTAASRPTMMMVSMPVAVMVGMSLGNLDFILSLEFQDCCGANCE